MKIAVAGASGFVGRNLIDQLAERGHEVLALSRSPIEPLPKGCSWRRTDLFSARSTLQAIEGAEVAVYLIHSMLPSTALFQGDFHDTDLLLADNFARACRRQGVKRIIYLGGLVPEGRISLHLESRREVEEVLKTSGVPVTALRAGMIVGPGGSSFEILQSLVQRLPVMLLPEWTQRQTQAIFIDDVIRVIAEAIEREEFRGKTIDLVNGESLTYERLLRQMSQTLGLKRKLMRVPIRSTGFSKLWVTLFGNSNYELVSPLIDSLLCDLPASKPDPLIVPLIRYTTFRQMAQEALRRGASSSAQAHKVTPQAAARRPRRKPKTVRSIQRLPALPEHNAQWISTAYMRWLPEAFVSFIQVRVDESSGSVTFHLGHFPIPLLELQYIQDDSDEDRKKFHIVGGLLSQTSDTGWLEFRQVAQRKHTIAAIHDFVPRLPWPVYLSTQALLHSWTMHRFGKYLKEDAR